MHCSGRKSPNNIWIGCICKCYTQFFWRIFISAREGGGGTFFWSPCILCNMVLYSLLTRCGQLWRWRGYERCGTFWSEQSCVQLHLSVYHRTRDKHRRAEGELCYLFSCLSINWNSLKAKITGLAKLCVILNPPIFPRLSQCHLVVRLSYV